MLKIKAVVSSDSVEYGCIATQYDADFLRRPDELATDASTDYDYVKHFLDNYDTELVLLLRPSTPLRERAIVQSALRQDLRFFDSMRSMHGVEPVEKYFRSESGLFAEPVSENPDLPRQQYTPCYHPNGYVDIVKADVVRNGSVYGKNIMLFSTPNVGEIDEEADFEYVTWRLLRYGSTVYEYLKETYPIRTF